MGSQLLDRVHADAAAVGMNMVGLVDRARYDASEPRERRIGDLAPACGTIVVLGSAGRTPARSLLDWNDGGGGDVRARSVRRIESS